MISRYYGEEVRVGRKKCKLFKKLNITSNTAEYVSILYLTSTSISLAVMGYRLVFFTNSSCQRHECYFFVGVDSWWKCKEKGMKLS